MDTRQYVNSERDLDTHWYDDVVTSEPSARLTREDRRAQTRERLLDAAADVFNRLGYHGASLEAVADAAGFTKGAVYSNFASKAELFAVLADRKGVAADLGTAREAFRAMSIDELIADPVAAAKAITPIGAPHPKIALPRDLFAPTRPNSWPSPRRSRFERRRTSTRWRPATTRWRRWPRAR